METKTTAKQRADARRYQARKEAAAAQKALEARVAALEVENTELWVVVDTLQQENIALHNRIEALEQR